MTKTTKVIAALGVVAGLGVAALPLSSYAADGVSVSSNVKVETTITSALAMRIQSNNDGKSYTAVTPENGADPSTKGWYEKDGDVYNKSTDTSVADGKTYYAQSDAYGFIGYEPNSAKAEADAAAIAGPSLATGLELSANQADLTSLWSNIEVRSNTGKFKVQLIDADDNTSLNLATPSTTENEFIPAQNGEPAAATAGWAVKGGDISDWTKMPKNASSDYDAESSTGTAAETALTVLANSTNGTTPLAYSAATKVNYGIASGITKTGVYSDIITYTATATN